jgi:hypothetical protein
MYVVDRENTTLAFRPTEDDEQKDKFLDLPKVRYLMLNKICDELDLLFKDWPISHPVKFVFEIHGQMKSEK